MSSEKEKITFIMGQRVRAFRNERKMSQEELAFASDIHPAYLGRVERGEKCPTIDTLYKLSKGLKVPLALLLDVNVEEKPSNLEAMRRIENALGGLPDEDAVRVAEIVECISEFRKKPF